MTRFASASQRTHTLLGSPLGPLLLVASGESLAGLYYPDGSRKPDPGAFGSAAATDSCAVLAAARRQLREYFAGERTVFDLPVAAGGTPFQISVWQALRSIPYGTTLSYGDIARRIGAPAASRAVGLANGRNPVSIVVPCHRVIGADGRLTGYAGGIERKRFLLDLERRTAGMPLP